MKSERVTQAWEFYRDNCPGFKEPMRKQFRRLDEYVSVVETENAKLKRAAERDADVMESLNLSLEESQAENAKLRELLKNALTYIEYEGCGVECPETGNSATLTSCDACNRYETESCAYVIAQNARELRIGVDE